MEKYQDITKLAGLVFIRRNFWEDILEQGLDAMLEQIATQGDLTADERAAFEACLSNPRLQKVVHDWWIIYDEERQAGAIPAVWGAWQP